MTRIPVARIFALLAASLLIWSHTFSNANVKVRVVVPKDTPDTARVFLAGSLPVLGNWRPDGLALTRTSDGSWQGEFSVRRGERIEFKVTLGSWDTEAIYQKSHAPGNTVLQVLADTTVVMAPVTWRHLGFSPPGGITGTVRYHRALTGQGLNYPKDVIVWLPPSYEGNPSKRYPVLYMHDGQNVIDPRTSYLGYDWRVDEVADSLIRAGSIEEIIVVGCSNSPDRAAEYSETDLGRAYCEFVVTKLKPLVDSTYRTLPGREYTGVMGSSMGGLISFLFVWWHPEVFSMAGCLSSAFSYGSGSILDAVESSTGLRAGTRVYLDCGTLDLEARLLPGTERMRKLLVSKGMMEGKDLLVVIDQGAAHNEPAWANRLWKPLTFMYGARK